MDYDGYDDDDDDDNDDDDDDEMRPETTAMTGIDQQTASKARSHP